MTTAREIMHAGAKCVGTDETLIDAARKMRDLGVGVGDGPCHASRRPRVVVLRVSYQAKERARQTGALMARGRSRP
jgi:hypothetical protein